MIKTDNIMEFMKNTFTIRNDMDMLKEMECIFGTTLHQCKELEHLNKSLSQVQSTKQNVHQIELISFLNSFLH